MHDIGRHDYLNIKYFHIQINELHLELHVIIICDWQLCFLFCDVKFEILVQCANLDKIFTHTSAFTKNGKSVRLHRVLIIVPAILIRLKT